MGYHQPRDLDLPERSRQVPRAGVRLQVTARLEVAARSYQTVVHLTGTVVKDIRMASGYLNPQMEVSAQLVMAVQDTDN